MVTIESAGILRDMCMVIRYGYLSEWRILGVGSITYQSPLLSSPLLGKIPGSTSCQSTSMLTSMLFPKSGPGPSARFEFTDEKRACRWRVDLRVSHMANPLFSWFLSCNAVSTPDCRRSTALLAADGDELLGLGSRARSAHAPWPLFLICVESPVHSAGRPGIPESSRSAS